MNELFLDTSFSIGLVSPRDQIHQIGIGLLDNFENDSNTTIVSLTDDLYNEAFKLFRSRNDKKWGLVDCISFVVMTERNITLALTADEHFVQEGFRALLRED